ncbi:MAG: tRNA 5-methoxyuridine(34)/uridine 5-oxyacetic acid(34) synthase CmoB [Gammaproteobacteria bacterium]|nr:tRNA 5-methoxyuridine(34)/uridine 5-oxyacetic acid(34) synthase CmoB [Gammaproteobacteria bacterium]
MKAPADPFFLQDLHQVDSGSPLTALSKITATEFIETLNHGDLSRWMEILEGLPPLSPGAIDLKSRVSIGLAADAKGRAAELEQQLRQFIPWRKGPFELFGVQIETEWQSDMKWGRLLPHIATLKNRKVLDVGCGNGYHCWRALGEGARLVIGVEPYLLYVMQFLALKNYLRHHPCYVLPVKLQDYPGPFSYYDTVFSMGVLYHVRSPIDHLLQLKKCLNRDGQLVLETLVVDGGEGYCLTPSDRYARMGNVWFIPSIATLNRWLQRCGFVEVKLVDTSITTTMEQHSTSWMPFKSLADGLDPDDQAKTCEGLPAPKRVIVTANSPG